jgi:hypothetical protein
MVGFWAKVMMEIKEKNNSRARIFKLSRAPDIDSME